MNDETVQLVVALVMIFAGLATMIYLAGGVVLDFWATLRTDRPAERIEPSATGYGPDDTLYIGDDES